MKIGDILCNKKTPAKRQMLQSILRNSGTDGAHIHIGFKGKLQSHAISEKQQKLPAERKQTSCLHPKILHLRIRVRKIRNFLSRYPLERLQR